MDEKVYEQQMNDCSSSDAGVMLVRLLCGCALREDLTFCVKLLMSVISERSLNIFYELFCGSKFLLHQNIYFFVQLIEYAHLYLFVQLLSDFLVSPL